MPRGRDLLLAIPLALAADQAEARFTHMPRDAEKKFEEETKHAVAVWQWNLHRKLQIATNIEELEKSVVEYHAELEKLLETIQTQLGKIPDMAGVETQNRFNRVVKVAADHRTPGKSEFTEIELESGKSIMIIPNDLHLYIRAMRTENAGKDTELDATLDTIDELNRKHTQKAIQVHIWQRKIGELKNERESLSN